MLYRINDDNGQSNDENNGGNEHEVLYNINEDKGQSNEETEGSDEHEVLYDINEDEGPINEGDEGQASDRVGVDLPTGTCSQLTRCCACEDGFTTHVEIVRAA